MFFIHGKLEAHTVKRTAFENGGDLTWETFSPDRVAAAIGTGQPMFIDFTADWCINCKVNESVVLDSDAVRSVLKAKNFLLLRADWTDGDPVITEWLHRFNRVGVPVYVIYNGKSSTPDVLPEILTKKLVLERLHAVGS